MFALSFLSSKVLTFQLDPVVRVQAPRPTGHPAPASPTRPPALSLPPAGPSKSNKEHVNCEISVNSTGNNESGYVDLRMQESESDTMRWESEIVRVCCVRIGSIKPY